MKKQVSIFWFRRDLRYEDNTALYESLNSGLPVLPIFIFDIDILNKLSDSQDRRVTFIYDALSELKRSFEQLGSSLLILNGKPSEIFEKLLDDYSVRYVFANRDYEGYAQKRDGELSKYLSAKGVELKLYKDQVIFEEREVVKSDHSPYTVFTPYSKAWKTRLINYPITCYKSEEYLINLYKTPPFPTPELSSIGFKRYGSLYNKPYLDIQLIRNYHNTRDYPWMDGTSGMGIYLRFGLVSIRYLVSVALVNNEVWLNELIWREFFMMIISNFPYVENGSFKREYDHIQWLNNKSDFERWCNGETGYPIVDAGMRELYQTGNMHNRVRMIVASFLTKHLLIDWRLGEAWFASKLNDYDLSANNGNWQWAAGSGCDAAPWFRIFNPYEQSRKFDPDSIYINKWLNNKNSQNYPQPIVKHEYARIRALSVYKNSLSEYKIR